MHIHISCSWIQRFNIIKVVILSQTDWWTEHNVNKTYSRFFFFFFLQQAEMSKAMQRTLFVNKSQINFQDSNDHKRYISFFPPNISNHCSMIIQESIIREKKAPLRP